MTARVLRTTGPWVALVLVGMTAAWLRYGLIESSVIGQQCGTVASPMWCTWRQWLVVGFLHNVYGVVALVTAVIAIFSRRLGVAWLAAALGLFALVLYCFQSGAIALLIGSLRLLRVQARAPPTAQDGPRQRDVQRQP